MAQAGPGAPTTVADPLMDGEQLHVSERVVVSPAAGVFLPLPPDTVTTEGEIVDLDQPIGVVRVSGGEVIVRSSFRGFLMGMTAHAGERVREGQAVAWLRAL